MKKQMFISAAIVLALFAGITSYAEDKVSVERGKELFNDPSLAGSQTQRSCNDCHKDGKKLENAGSKDNLDRMINGCIKNALQGEPLSTDSADFKSIRLYIQSLGK